MMTFAFVRFAVPGWHYWPEAPEARAYLRARHRHQFQVEIGLELYGDDREVEFHDLLDLARAWFPGGDMARMSCEQMAEDVIQRLTDAFPGRSGWVSVSEDGEAGAVVQF